MRRAAGGVAGIALAGLALVGEVPPESPDTGDAAGAYSGVHADAWGFTQGLSPILDPERGDAPAWVPAAECGGCHAEQYADWLTSRHRVAWSNEIFQAGYIAEPRDFCVYCHAPSAVQSAEALANGAWYRAQHPEYEGDWQPERLPEPHAAEGVSCVACHWRDGAVVATEWDPSAPHATRVEADLQDPALCKGCHEFPVPTWRDGEILLTDDPMQSTWTEWRAWADGVEAAGGQAATCQNCHMPGGRHLFRGAHDQEALRASIQVEVTRDDAGISWLVETVGVGHAMPTGDLFRNITLEVQAAEGDEWQVIDRMGREFAVSYDPALDRFVKRPVGDTCLYPGQPREVTWAGEATRWRLRYHYGSEFDEGRGMLDLDVIVITLREGELRAGD